MPKIFNKEVPTIVILGMGVVACVLGYNAAFPTVEPVKSSISKGSPRAASGSGDIYTKEDYSIRFVSSADKPRDTFQPLVIRKGGSGAQGGIPTTYTAGEPNWMFTGMVTVDGLRQALLENKSGDSEFVISGQHWKSSTIGDITADMLTLRGPGDSQYVAAVGTASEPTPATDVNPTVGPVTVAPGMVGAIGNGNPMMPNQGGQGYGGGYGRRRGRNRGFNPNNQGN